MAKLDYFIVHAPIKDIAEAMRADNFPHEETHLTTLQDLKETAYNEEDSVMTVCDNFITIYGYPTWAKKFGR